MIRIGFTGVPGTGKTSTARAFGAACRRIDEFKNVELIAEYARRFITKYGSNMEIMDQFRIIQKQIEWENTVPPNCNLMITDSPASLSYMYVIQRLNRTIEPTPKDIMYVNDIYKTINKLNVKKPRYDIIFHLSPDIKPVNDGVRRPEEFDDTWRAEKDQEIRYITGTLFKPVKFYVMTSIDLEDRVQEAYEETAKFMGIGKKK